MSECALEECHATVAGRRAKYCSIRHQRLAAKRRWAARRRARQHDNERPYNRTLWARTLRQDPCAYCGSRGGSIDHIDGLGPDSPPNLTGACVRCNSAKGKASLLGFLLARRLGDEVQSLEAQRSAALGVGGYNPLRSAENAALWAPSDRSLPIHQPSGPDACP